MVKKHWTPNYVRARIRQILYQKRNPHDPWLTPQAVSLLSQLLGKEDSVLEFGSGRSTTWFAQRCASVISVEHDEKYFKHIRAKLAGYDNVNLLYKSLDNKGTGNTPVIEPEYVAVLDSFPDNAVSVLINDGCVRGAIAKRSVGKVIPGGMIVIDNAERYLPNRFKLPESRLAEKPECDWKAFCEQTERWRRIWTSDGVTATLLLFKPCY